MEDNDGTLPYEAYRDRALKHFGPEDPWAAMVSRMTDYNPRDIPAKTAISELQQLQRMWNRVAERIYKDKPIILHEAKEAIIPRAIVETFRRGVADVNNAQFTFLFAGDTYPTVLKIQNVLGKNEGVKLDFAPRNRPVPRNLTRYDEPADKAVSYLSAPPKRAAPQVANVTERGVQGERSGARLTITSPSRQSPLQSSASPSRSPARDNNRDARKTIDKGKRKKKALRTLPPNGP